MQCDCDHSISHGSMPRPHKYWHDELPEELVLCLALYAAYCNTMIQHMDYTSPRMDGAALTGCRKIQPSKKDLKKTYVLCWPKSGSMVNTVSIWTMLISGCVQLADTACHLKRKTKQRHGSKKIESVSIHEHDNLPSQAPASVQPSQAPGHEGDAQKITASIAGMEGVSQKKCRILSKAWSVNR